MDKLKLTGPNMGNVFNFISVHVHL
jgi:hypothetical protein